MPTLAPAQLLEARALVEHVIGRPLRLAEQAVDVLRLDGALNTAKDELDQAVKLEMRRAVRRAIARGGAVKINLTRPMLLPLERLFRLGLEEGEAELRRHGYRGLTIPLRRLLEDAPARYHALDRLHRRIRHRLDQLEGRVTDGLVHADLAALSAAAVAQALMRTPGARDLASQVVSTALNLGFAQVFEENDSLVGGWERTAILDGATCDPCAESDGTTYATWAEAQDEMPNGGPAANCDGGDRCRCRLVPAPA